MHNRLDTDRLDEEILTVLKDRNYLTYVVANSLRMDHARHNGTLKTSRVLSRLKTLESKGKVERKPSCYARQIKWGLITPAKPR